MKMILIAPGVLKTNFNKSKKTALLPPTSPLLPAHLGRSRVPSSRAGRGTAPCSGRRGLPGRHRTAGSPPRTSPPDTLQRKQPRLLAAFQEHQSPHAKGAAGSVRRRRAVHGLQAAEEAHGPGRDPAVGAHSVTRSPQHPAPLPPSVCPSIASLLPLVLSTSVPSRESDRSHAERLRPGWSPNCELHSAARALAGPRPGQQPQPAVPQQAPAPRQTGQERCVFALPLSHRCSSHGQRPEPPRSLCAGVQEPGRTAPKPPPSLGFSELLSGLAAALAGCLQDLGAGL